MFVREASDLMSAKLYQIVKTAPYVNQEAVDLVEGLLERLKSGHSVAVGLVEVYADGSTVATAYSNSHTYHQMCSGCARLAARIALD